MAVYRIHRKEWEKGSKQQQPSKKRKKPEDDDEGEEHPGGGRKGVSSGLSTIVTKRGGASPKGVPVKKSWWKETGAGAKGTMKL